MDLAGCALPSSDAGACAATLTAGAATDGGANSCGACYNTVIPPVGNSPGAWGYYLLIGFEPSVGDWADAFLVGGGMNLGGCIMATDPSAEGQACGADIMGLLACEMAVCLPVCAVPDPGPGNPLDPAALAAMQSCWQLAETGACATWLGQADVDCEAGDAEASAYSACSALVDQDEGQPDAGAPTEASEAQLLGLLCGE